MGMPVSLCPFVTFNVCVCSDATPALFPLLQKGAGPMHLVAFGCTLHVLRPHEVFFHLIPFLLCRLDAAVG